MQSINLEISYSYIPITENKVGTWKFNEPFIEEKIPPCSFNCPITQEIREVMILIENKKYEESFLKMFDKNPLLYTTGTVCPAFCRQNCNRKEIEDPIAINEIEAYLGKEFINYDIKNIIKNEKKDKKVCIIGFGPAGISLSYQLAKEGYQVEVFEKMPRGGGIPYYGIPDLRLDKKILEKEVKRIESIKNIKVNYNHNISPEDLKKLNKEYDHVVVATGMWEPLKPENIDGKILYGIETLINYHTKKYIFPQNGHYFVLGGGNTAMDVALYLLKNSNKVDIIVRRDVLRAFEKEIEEVKRLGANFIFKSSLKKWNEKEKRAIILSEDKEREMNVDGVFACFGQIDEVFKKVDIDKIGDLGGYDANVSTAIFSGLKKAFEIMGKELEKNDKIAKIDLINKDIIEKKPYKEIKDKETLRYEAQRCIKCGTCTACKVCETFCPDFAINVNDKAEFDYDYCKGCGICYTECPRGVISLREVNR